MLLHLSGERDNVCLFDKLIQNRWVMQIQPVMEKSDSIYAIGSTNNNKIGIIVMGIRLGTSRMSRAFASGSARLVSESWLGSFRAEPKNKGSPSLPVKNGLARLGSKVKLARLVCQLTNSCWL
jgi:hypothetical protein